MQDNIVMYNEVIDTLRAIMNMFKFYKKRRLAKWNKNKSPSSSPRPEFRIDHQPRITKDNNPLLFQANKYDMLDELMREFDDEIDVEGYTIEKDLIVQAWTRFRPVNKPDKEQEGGQSISPQKTLGGKPRT